MRKLAFLCLSASLFASFASNAYAADTSLRIPTTHRVRTRYFTDTLLCDLGAVTSLVTGVAVRNDRHDGASDVLLVGSGVTYAIGAPIAHLARGRP